MGYGRDEYDRIANAIATPKATCAHCGHVDHATEFYSQSRDGVASQYCRNHNTCQTRFNTNRKEQTMQFGTYEEPAQAAGDTYKPRDNYGHSAIVRVTEHKPSVVTPNSPNGAPAVIVDVYDLNLKQTFRDVLLMTGSLVDAFKPHVAKPPIVVRWEKTVAANGRDYARAVPAVEAAVEAAKNVYATGDPFLTLGELGNAAEEEAPF
jgi:hypothetical protein